MAYVLTNPPKCLMPTIGGFGPSIFTYQSTDAATVVDQSGYISNARDLGMKVGDVVFVTDTDASPIVMTTHIVTAINATTGAADLSDTGATVGSTNSD